MSESTNKSWCITAQSLCGATEAGTDRIGMSAVLMLGAVRCIAERLAASRILAHIRLFARVRPQVSLQILQPRVRLVAALKLHSTTRR